MSGPEPTAASKQVGGEAMSFADFDSPTPAKAHAARPAVRSGPRAMTASQGATIIGLLIAVVVQLVVATLRPAMSCPPQWEYMIATPDDAAFAERMDGLGRNGWEVVAARRASDGLPGSPKFGYEIILKRPRR
jgi:hypothetical protein